MARIFTEGFESGDGEFWDVINGAIEDDPVRSGAYSWNMNSTNAQRTLPAALTEFYIRFGWRVSGFNTNHQLRWYNGTTQLGKLAFSSALDGKLAFTVGSSTLVATGTISLALNTFYLIEVHIKFADAPNGVLEAKIDGVLDPGLSFTGDTKPSTQTNITSVGWNCNSGFAMYLDDLALNDTAGGADNSWCGDGHVIALLPNAAGDVTGLTPSAGSNYQNVDERPADGDTTYNESATADDYDLYALSACGLSNVNILRVWAEARAKDTVAAGGNCQLGLKTESTEYWSSNISLLTTYTQQLLGTVHTVNPNTSAAWTTTQLDALQAGFKVK